MRPLVVLSNLSPCRLKKFKSVLQIDSGRTNTQSRLSYLCGWVIRCTSSNDSVNHLFSQKKAWSFGPRGGYKTKTLKRCFNKRKSRRSSLILPFKKNYWLWKSLAIRESLMNHRMPRKMNVNIFSTITEMSSTDIEAKYFPFKWITILLYFFGRDGDKNSSYRFEISTLLVEFSKHVQIIFIR